MIKNIKYIFILILSIFINSHLVNANIDKHVINFNKTGSVSITMTEPIENINIQNAEITIYKIATVTSIDNYLIYQYDEPLNKCSADLTDLSNSSLPNQLEECILDNNVLKETKLTNELGTVKFDNLELGLYLIKQTNKLEGYSVITPFIITIPKEENNEWIYDVIASPKTDITRLVDLSVEKRWDNTDKQLPKEVTIELLKDNQVIDAIKLNENNNWIYIWKQLEKSDKYSVREINIPEGYTATYRQEENKFIVNNTKILVQTGEYSFLVPLLTSIGLSLIIIGMLLKKRTNCE